MPIETPERPVWELTDTEATSKAVAKVNWQRIEDLVAEGEALKRDVRDLRAQLDNERSLRTQYETHYSATYAPLVILTVICGLVAGLLTTASSRSSEVVLVLVFLACVGAIIRLCSFRPRGK